MKGKKVVILGAGLSGLSVAYFLKEKGVRPFIFEKEDNPFMFDLLEYLDKKHDVKALINTSFNVRGEPIVHTTEDALKSAKNMALDAVILNGVLSIL